MRRIPLTSLSTLGALESGQDCSGMLRRIRQIREIAGNEFARLYLIKSRSSRLRPCSHHHCADHRRPVGFAFECLAIPLRHFDTSAVRQVIRNPRGAEGVAPYRGFDSRIRNTAAHHAPHILARHGKRRKLFGFADGRAEQPRPAVVLDASRFNVGVEIFFELGMTRSGSEIRSGCSIPPRTSLGSG